jgi:phage-related protein
MWTVETLDTTVGAEIAALPSDIRARLGRISFLIEEFGVERVREPSVKHLQGSIWEMRMTGRDGISRALYLAPEGCRVITVRVFVKKTQKTPN